MDNHILLKYALIFIIIIIISDSLYLIRPVTNQNMKHIRLMIPSETKCLSFKIKVFGDVKAYISVASFLNGKGEQREILRLYPRFFQDSISSWKSLNISISGQIHEKVIDFRLN